MKLFLQFRQWIHDHVLLWSFRESKSSRDNQIVSAVTNSRHLHLFSSYSSSSLSQLLKADWLFLLLSSESVRRVWFISSGYLTHLRDLFRRTCRLRHEMISDKLKEMRCKKKEKENWCCSSEASLHVSTASSLTPSLKTEYHMCAYVTASKVDAQACVCPCA